MRQPFLIVRMVGVATLLLALSQPARAGCDGPVCGNDVRERGEACDGGNLCSAICTLSGVGQSCCEFPAGASPGCLDTPPFSLEFYVSTYCGTQNATSYLTGGVCGASGNCEYVAIDPVPLCCENVANHTCSSSGSASNTGQLWAFFHDCEGFTSGTYHTVPGETCGAGGTCVAS